MVRGLVIELPDAGRRLDAWLASALGISRGAADRLVAGGLVTVDGKVASSKALRLKTGSQIDVGDLPKEERERPPAPYSVRFEDEHLAVVAKPAGVVVHPAPGTRDETLVEALSRRMPLSSASGENRPGVVHRLDKGTSGLLVVAKTDAAYHALVELMRRRAIERTYLALVVGRFAMPAGRIEAPVGRRRQRRGMEVTSYGRDAATSFEVAEELAGMSLVTVKLHTGRTHQIRVHLAHIEHPVVADSEYGRNTAALARALGLKRPFLHAARLSFAHPLEERTVDVSEPLPGDLQSALKKARILSEEP